MTDAEPTLPEVDASEMASLQTLGQIVDYMNAQMGVSGTPAATAVETVVETKKTAALGRFLVEAVDAPAVGLSLKGFAGKGPVYIVGGSGEVATAVAGELTDRGVTVEVVTDAPEGGAKAIFLGGLAQVDADGAREVNRHAFRTARTLAKQASLFVTVQDTGADFGLSGSDNAWVGGLAALVKTASQEWKDAGLRALDIEVKDRTPSELATVLVDELLDGGNEREVGLAADGTRRTLVANLTPVEGGDATIDADSVVLASGGARGVTAATLIELSARTKATFLLMGRTPLVDEDPALLGLDETGLKRHLLMAAKASGELVSPAVVGKKVSKILAQREVRGTLAKMAANGSSAQYLACDVTDEAGIRAAIETANVGKVTAIVHGAGVLADRYIADKTNDQFDFVFDTKVNGLRALLAATGSELSALVLFSSVAARGGNAGQCDYAMANEVLNKVAWQFAAQNPGTLVKSLGWGPWEGGMVTPALKARFESLGVPLIPLQSGANMLCDELLSSARTSVELVLGGEPTEEALIDDGDRDRVDFELVVTEKSMPWLNDHSIQGAPVVPVVLAAEWFARAARGTRPDLKLVAVQEIKVLRGIRIADFAWGAVFTVTSKQLRNGQGALLALELRGADGTLHYTANAELADDARVGGSPLAEHANLETWKDEVYDGHMLFHGPEFQVIRELEGVSDEGAAAVLEGVQSRAWNQTFTTDVAAMDGGLQLAVLWAKRMLGGASLPTKLGEMTVYAEGPAKGPIKAVLQARKVTSATTVSDIVFQADGNTVAELKGVETCLRPS
ncbi:MAG: SDR family oxidoreductase, partial [Proteobacteria bacterium]|nr:SDR family oxidoreductase [Pseudomonadota bacterium]